MLYGVKECNGNQDLDGCMIGSFDVEALYPSIDIDFAIEKCLQLISESEFQFKSIDSTELGLYLSLTMDKNERIKLNLYDYCPTRGCGRPPTITSSGCKTNYEKRWKGWTKASKLPDDVTQKKMLIQSLKIVLQVILRNHVCKFNKRLYKQKEGGAIGVSLAGDIANLFMIWWDRELKKGLYEQKLLLKLYTRYVDDGNIAINKIKNNDNDDENPEKVTMNKVKDIANNIHQSIKVKVDFPSNYRNNRLPVLDMEFWIEEVEINGQKRNTILYSHYIKPVASRYVIHKKSAMSYKTKIHVLINELIRIMRNISPHVAESERRSHIQYFMNRLQFSGYSKEDRIIIYRKAKTKFDEKLKNDRLGVIPLYRSKLWNLGRRKNDKERKQREWYTKGGYKSTLFVDATPNEELARKCQSLLHSCGLPIKVLEKSGKSIKQHLVKSDPFKETKCSDQNCPICISNTGINCKTRDVVYKHECEDYGQCKGIYIGETSDSIKERTCEHAEKRKQENKDSAHFKHNLTKHNGKEQRITVSILGHCPNDPMLRQCMESILIKDMEPNMNSKEECTNSKKPREQLTSTH